MYGIGEWVRPSVCIIHQNILISSLRTRCVMALPRKLRTFNTSHNFESPSRRNRRHPYKRSPWCLIRRQKEQNHILQKITKTKNLQCCPIYYERRWTDTIAYGSNPHCLLQEYFFTIVFLFWLHNSATPIRQIIILFWHMFSDLRVRRPILSCPRLLRKSII